MSQGLGALCPMVCPCSEGFTLAHVNSVRFFVERYRGSVL